MIRRSRVVIVICAELEDTVRALDAGVPTVLIENASGDPPVPGAGRAIRADLSLTPETPIVLYTGTFEAYQGLDLLYDAMAIVHARQPEARLVMVGGEPAQVDAARRDVASRGLAEAVLFTGQRTPEDVPRFLDAATVLVSPRSTGTNTPLKIYQYLRSGRPIVATNLRTHTQVLDDDTAVLVAPDAVSFADGILDVLTNGDRAAEVGRRARELADTKYSDEAFLDRTRHAFALLSGDDSSTIAGDAA